MALNPKLVAMARESRGLTQGQLADALNISQSKLSKLETGTLDGTEDDIACLSSTLRYTPEFFQKTAEECFGLGSMCIFHRKRASAQAGMLRILQAKINIFRMQVASLTSDVDIELSFKLHRLDVDQFGGPVESARELRRLWKLPLGPVGNLVGLIERAGVIVWNTDLGSDRIDAVSQVVEGHRPVFLMNARSPADRLRFSLCHELGHVIMHNDGSPNKEQEADQFASEFLMPAKDIKPMLAKLTLDKAATLKAAWRVSMAALIKRAADLGQISERHYRTLFTQMSQHGWRVLEPVAIPAERPTALQGVLRVQVEDHGLGTATLARRAYLLDVDEFVQLFSPPSKPGSSGLRVVG